MIVGLTGGIASGKSTVSAMLAARGAYVVDADRIAREVVEPGQPALEQVAAHFGPDVLAPDGTLNRRKLGDIVFGNTQARKALEAILHPPIRATLHSRLSELDGLYPDKLIVADIPLLYESGWDRELTEIIVVYVPVEVQIRRLQERDGLTEEEALARIKAQMPIETKRSRSDVVIDNSGTLAETEDQVKEYMSRKLAGS